VFDAIMHAGKLDEVKAKNLFGQICDAVALCHKNSVSHRNLKPENIILQDGIVKLADFGLSISEPLCDDFCVGSDRYMCPDMPHSSVSNDVWSLGVILINLFTGSNPWAKACTSDPLFTECKDPSLATFETDYGLSKQLCRILRKVFDMDPFERPSANELKASVMNIPLLAGRVLSADVSLLSIFKDLLLR
jgi:serine/threonine protein kinase